MSAAPNPGESSSVRIGRVTLTVPAMSEAEARRLAELVADALGQLSIPLSANGTSTSVVVDQEPGFSMENLARSIAARAREAFWTEGAR